MYYSITFTNSAGVSKNTWTDWSLIPSTPPQITPPEPYTNYVDIPGRPEGPIDLSEVLTNGLAFNNSEGDWAFISVEENENRIAKIQEMKRFLHGQKLKIYLEEEPGYYHKGRIIVGGFQTGRGPNGYQMKYIVEPMRYDSATDEPDGI